MDIGIPKYRNDVHFRIGAYCSPPKENCEYVNSVTGQPDTEYNIESFINEVEFKRYKDAGFNFILTEYNGQYDPAVERFEDSSLYRFMEVAEATHTDTFVSTPPLSEMTSVVTAELGEAEKTYIRDLMEHLSRYKSFKGLSLRDEPKAEYLDRLSAVMDYAKSLKPDVEFFTSMLPLYGSCVVSFTANEENCLEEYSKYVIDCMEKTGRFFYDFYPLMTDPKKGNFLRPGWFSNLEFAASRAKKKNAPIGITVQSGSWGKPGRYQKEIQIRDVADRRDIGFQVYSALAYGCKTIGYFTYWLHWGGNEIEVFYSGMVMPPKGEEKQCIETPAYDAVRQINEEISKFDHVLMHFNWNGTMALSHTKKNKSLREVAEYKTDRIKKATVSQNTIIGHLTDENGYDGFMIVNVTEPSKNIGDHVKITFRDCDRALCYINGDEQIIPSDNGTFEFDIGSGEGIFVIPFKGEVAE